MLLKKWGGEINRERSYSKDSIWIYRGRGALEMRDMKMRETLF